MSYLYKSPHELSEGYTCIVSPANSPAKIIELGRLILTSKLSDYAFATGDNEMVISLQSGAATITVEGDNFTRKVYKNFGGRKDVRRPAENGLTFQGNRAAG